MKKVFYPLACCLAAGVLVSCSGQKLSLIHISHYTVHCQSSVITRTRLEEKMFSGKQFINTYILPLSLIHL